jgi:hypothetical protein
VQVPPFPKGILNVIEVRCEARFISAGVGAQGRLVLRGQKSNQLGEVVGLELLWCAAPERNQSGLQEQLRGERRANCARDCHPAGYPPTIAGLQSLCGQLSGLQEFLSRREQDVGGNGGGHYDRDRWGGNLDVYHWCLPLSMMLLAKQ